VAASAARAERRLRRVGVRPLTGPLTVSGLSAPLGRALAAAGRRTGRPVLVAPAGPLGSFPAQTLRPGSAVAVGYSSGDLRLGAIGTVAYTDGDAVWAFGHPFEAAGARSLLLQDAYVYHVVNDPNTGPFDGGSYKLAAPGHDLGTLSNDALDAVVGRVGAPAPTIPIRVRAHDDDTGRTQTLAVDAADEAGVGNPTGYSPLGQVGPLAILQAGTNVLGAAPGRLAGHMCMSIAFRGRAAPARFCNRYVSSDNLSFAFGLGNGVALAATFDALSAFGLVDGYAGRPPHVRAVDATLHVARGEHTAELRRVTAPRTARPGRRVRLRVALQRLHGTRMTRRFRVRLPRGLRPGRHVLQLAGGASGSPDEDPLIALLLGDESDGSSRAPTTLAQLSAAIAGLHRYDGVVARVGHRRFRAFRDRHLLITGRARAVLHVRG
jgi:hypothetical protein